MSRFLWVSLLIFSNFSFAVGNGRSAQFKNSEEIVSTLKNYSTDKMKDEKTAVDALMEIRRAVEFSKSHALSDEAFQQLLKTSSDTFKDDPNFTAAGILVPLYEKDPATFKKNLKALPEKSQQELLKQIELSKNESAKGNG